jgi:hypothetical protein
LLIDRFSAVILGLQTENDVNPQGTKFLAPDTAGTDASIKVTVLICYQPVGTETNFTM